MKNSKFRIISALIFLLCFFGVAKNSYAATYYMANNPSSGNSGWGNGSNSNTGTKDSPWLTMKYAAAHMLAGDTLIIDDGTYGLTSCLTTDSDIIPEGNPTVGYTTFRAENDGKVIIDAGGAVDTLKIYGNDTVDGLPGTSASHDYLEFRGILFVNSISAGIKTYNINHLKLLNCGVNSTGGGGWGYGYSVAYSTDVLLEGCYYYGGTGRYGFSTFHSDRIVFRNCVARMDRADNSQNATAPFSAYSSANVEFQNCIDVDSDQSPIHYSLFSGDYNISGGFGTPETSIKTITGPVNITNCISLNSKLRFGSYDDQRGSGGNISDAHITNSVGWHYRTPYSKDFIHSFGNSYFSNCTFGDVDTQDGSAVQYAWFNGYSGGANMNNVNSSIWFNFLHGGLFYTIESPSDNNNIYGIGGNAVVSGISPANTKTYNPLSNGLLYLPRTESGSQLKTDSIGANIVYQYGKSETLYGETGYNILQDGTNGQDLVSLWPFPNEDLIKEKMSEYIWDDGSGGEVEITGSRGFAANGTGLYGGPITLTSYIWEYLGNACPHANHGDPCYYNSGSGDATAPYAPAGLSVR